MNELIDEYPANVFRFNAQDFAKFKEMTWVYLRLYASLAKTYMQQGKLLFDLTVKSHYMAHLMMQCEWLSPRLSWTFAGEDFMHIMKILPQSCVKGTQGPKVAAKILGKYRLTLELRFNKVL